MMLKFFLLANCLSCAVFGFLFAFYSDGAAAFIGDPPSVLVFIVGLVLLGNAVLLWLTAIRWMDQKLLIAFFVIGDVSWVILTLSLILSGTWISGSQAVISALLVAGIVGSLGFGQWFFGLRSSSRT